MAADPNVYTYILDSPYEIYASETHHQLKISAFFSCLIL